MNKRKPDQERKKEFKTAVWEFLKTTSLGLDTQVFKIEDFMDFLPSQAISFSQVILHSNSSVSY